jgi:uncharacterized 2Fe-2S/4Fe-4S cluster protein (DUF4445 family)
MPQVTVSYGTDERSVVVEEKTRLGDAIITTGLPLEQPCAGRGTCLKCKVIATGKLSPIDQVESGSLTSAERAVNYRLACRAQVHGDVAVTLAPIVVYSNKIFHASDEYKRAGTPLGLAIDLGSTTVAALVTTLDPRRVCAGAAALNQQTAYGADVISRLDAAMQGSEPAARLSVLALASIVQAVDALKLSPRMKERVQRIVIVGNSAMHHLLMRLPVETLALLPFQPSSLDSIRLPGRASGGVFGDTFPAQAQIDLPPLIGGFVGSDALACLAYYGFDRAPGPMAAIDLGTNGEVMVTDGHRILVASTAAGPAFEGVNISCGTRAVDGAIVGMKANASGDLTLTTIGDQSPVGLTGSGLIELIHEMRQVGLITPTGRMVGQHPTLGDRLSEDDQGVRRFLIAHKEVDSDGQEHSPLGNDLSDPGGHGEPRGLAKAGPQAADALSDAPVPLYLTQHDVRELQKAKAATYAAMEILLARLGLGAADLQRVILTGSFGSQLNTTAVMGLGMIPAVEPQIVETSPNGAGLGAALFLDEEEFMRGERIAAKAEQIDLDRDPDFNQRYVGAMSLVPRK